MIFSGVGDNNGMRAGDSLRWPRPRWSFARSAGLVERDVVCDAWHKSLEQE